MQNLTITIDDSLLRSAQDYAVKQGTTLSQIVQAHLVELTGFDETKHVNRLEKRWPLGESEPVRVPQVSEGNASLSFKIVEEPGFSPSNPLTEDSSSPFDTPELSPPQLDQKIAEMFKQVLQRKNER
jgi:hypothetical protein